MEAISTHVRRAELFFAPYFVAAVVISGCGTGSQIHFKEMPPGVEVKLSEAEKGNWANLSSNSAGYEIFVEAVDGVSVDTSARTGFVAEGPGFICEQVVWCRLSADPHTVVVRHQWYTASRKSEPAPAGSSEYGLGQFTTEFLCYMALPVCVAGAAAVVLAKDGIGAFGPSKECTATFRVAPQAGRSYVIHVATGSTDAQTTLDLVDASTTSTITSIPCTQ